MPLGRKHLRRSRDAPTGGIGHTQRTTSRLGSTQQEVNLLDVPPVPKAPDLHFDLEIEFYLHSILFHCTLLSLSHSQWRRSMTSQADTIRTYARERYVKPARGQREKRFTIRTGDVVRDMKLVGGRTPAVCSALKTREFLRENSLRLVSRTGPESGQSTTVTYTYEFISEEGAGKIPDRQEAWNRLRGALKDVFAELGGGENYLRNERSNFYGPGKDR
jgi:hypothetical protein